MSPGSPDEGTWGDESSRDPAVGSSHEVPSRWLGPDTPDGKVCGCRPGVPFTPPYVVCPYCNGPGEVPHTPQSPCDPSNPPAGWDGSCCGPSSSPERRDGNGTLFHSLHGVGKDGCYCEVLCLCAIRTRSDRCFRLLALVTRLGATPRLHRTGGVHARRRGPPGLPVGFRTSAGRPMVLSLPLTAISSRGTSMRPSTRCGACARATLSG